MTMEIATRMVFASALETLLVIRVFSALPVITQAIAANVCTFPQFFIILLFILVFFIYRLY